MKRNPILASVFSLLIPGAGQMYCGQSLRGAAILLAVIVVGNLNAIWLTMYAAQLSTPGPPDFWAQVLPRLLHDLFAFYGVVFLAWQIADAFLLGQDLHKNEVSV